MAAQCVTADIQEMEGVHGLAVATSPGRLTCAPLAVYPRAFACSYTPCSLLQQLS